MLLYGNTLQNGYALDDNLYTTENTFIKKGFSDFKDIFDKGSLYGYNGNNKIDYRPLTLLSFMAEVSIFGLNPHVSHFFNILFYAITVVLLYFFLQRVLKNYNSAIYVAATLLFAFHPIHTEAVANIKSRDEILGLLFGLGSFYFIILYQEENKRKYYFLSLAAFFTAIFCKENCLTFIFIIPLLLYFFSSLEVNKIIFRTLPFIGVVVFSLLIRTLILEKVTFTYQIAIRNNALMAATNSMDRIATSFVLLGKYIYMTIVPYPLCWDYSYNQIPIVSWGNIKPLLSLVACFILFGFALAGLRKKNIYSFCILFFFITLFLSSNLVLKIAATFAERFLYVPSLGFCILLPVLVAGAMKLKPTQLIWKTKMNFYFLLICLLIIYAAIVIPRNEEWKNNFTIEYAGAITSPNSGRTHNALGETYRDSAEKSVEPAKKQQYYSLATNEFKRAAEIFYMDPYYDYNLAECYNERGIADSAIPAYKKTLLLSPNDPRALSNLGAIYNDKKQYDTALAYLLLAYKVDSNNLAALINSSAAYVGEKKYALAFHFDSLALKIDPKNKTVLMNSAAMYNNMGVAYFNNNQLDKAFDEFETALVYDSNWVDAIGNIGIIYLKKGKNKVAKEYFGKALVKDPKNEQYQKFLKMLDDEK